MEQGQAQEEENGFSWENRYVQSWEALREDATTGALIMNFSAAGSAESAEYLRKRRAAADAALRRSIMRHLVIIMDWSQAASSNEVSPSRAIWIVNNAVRPFLREFFEQNPLSQVAILALRDGLAENIGGGCLSASLAEHEASLDTYVNTHEPAGSISLHNGLEVAMSILAHVPSHGSREVLWLQVSLSSLDTGNIFEISQRLTSARMRLAVAALAGEVSIARRIALQTGGSYAVALDDAHFVEIVREQLTPPAVYGTTSGAVGSSYAVRMGFPQQKKAEPGLCACHGTLPSSQKSVRFQCPQCRALICQLPMDCPLCKLTLISAPHLAKSYHHLFPVSAYTDMVDVSGEERGCFACGQTLEMTSSTTMPSNPWKPGRCNKCQQCFCPACTRFIHTCLYNCPGCLT